MSSYIITSLLRRKNLRKNFYVETVFNEFDIINYLHIDDNWLTYEI